MIPSPSFVIIRLSWFSLPMLGVFLSYHWLWCSVVSLTVESNFVPYRKQYQILRWWNKVQYGQLCQGLYRQVIEGWINFNAIHWIVTMWWIALYILSHLSVGWWFIWIALSTLQTKGPRLTQLLWSQPD